MTVLQMTPPKPWLDTKRGVGMAMAGVGTLLPLLAAYFGVTIDAATWGAFTAEVVKWFDITWNVVGYGLWAWGSIFPTAPLKTPLVNPGK